MDHLDDALLARFLDGEASPLDRRSWESHLRECVPCAAAMTELRANAQQLRNLMGASDVEVPAMAISPAGSAGPWRRFVTPAAVAAFLAFLVISPTRAWIASSIRTATSRLWDRGEATPPELAVTPRETNDANEVRVGVPLSGDVLTIRLASRQVSGRMTIEVVSVRTAYAEVVNGDVEELVVAEGLFIRNGVTSTSSYRVGVPERLSTVTLQVGDEAERTFLVQSAGVSWIVELGPIPNE